MPENKKNAAKKAVKKVAVKKVAKKAVKKVAKKAAVKKTATKVAKKAAVRKVARKAAKNKVAGNEAEIQLAAYFIFKNRIEKSLPGNAESDWLAAREKVGS